MHLLLSRSRKFIFLHSNPPYDTETYTVLKKMLSPGYMKVLEELVSFLMLVGLFEGGLAYWVLEQLYLWTFEISTRQQRSKNRLVEDEARAKEPDWENPHVVGRNRRKAHAPLRSFPDIVTSVSYWTTRFQHTHHDGSDEGHMQDFSSSSQQRRGKSSVHVPSTAVHNKALRRSELTPNIKYLTGQCGEPDENNPWRFLLVGQPSETPRDFPSPAFNDRGTSWSEVALPGHWQLQGHDIPIYTNTSYPFAFDPPRARRNGEWKLQDCDVGIGCSPEPSHPNGAKLHQREPGENPTGLYRRTFSLPSDWRDPASECGPQELGLGEYPGLPRHRVFMVFEGVDSAFNVYVNGVHVGYSQDSCLSAEFEVTDALAQRDASHSEHTVAVQVMRWSDGSYLEDQDKWWLSGIYREVYLLRKPATFIADYEFSTELVETDDNRVDAVYSVHVLVEETYPSEEAFAVRAELRRLNPNTTRAQATESSLMGLDFGEPVSVEVGLMEANKEMTMRENADGLGTVVSEPGTVEERGYTDDEGDFIGTHRDWCHKQIRSFYQTHNPDKVGELEDLFAKYEGQEAAMLALAHEKYGVEVPRKASGFNVRDAKKRRGCVEIRGEVPAPALWTAESPNLYVLILTLHQSLEEARDFNSFMNVGQGNAQVLDVESTRVGFRTVSLLQHADRLQHGKLCVNNIPITLCGVNRHEFHHQRGRSVSEADMQQDASLLKQFNFNAVRLSHYPTHPRWLEICDECGLYVVDEANIETHGFQTLGQATNYLSGHKDWEGAMLSRVVRMYERDKNATCIISWSLGNESGCGSTTLIMAEWLRNRDFSRVVQYESGGARTAATDIICPMYQRPEWCREQALHDPKKRPVILCEYAHAMGNSGGCLKQYWTDIWSDAYPRLQGAFVWDMIDQGLQLESYCPKYGGVVEPGVGYGGDFGDLPNTHQFCINGLFGPFREPHPSAYEAKACMSAITACLVERAIEEREGESPAMKVSSVSDSGGAGGRGAEEPGHLLGVIRTCFEQVRESELCIRLTNRRSFTTLDDLLIRVSFRCNLSSDAQALSSIDYGSAASRSNDSHEFIMSGASVHPNGGYVDIDLADAFESIYLEGKGSLDASLGAPPEADTPSALVPYLHSSTLTEVWAVVTVDVKDEHSTYYIPSRHEVYRQTLPHVLLLDAVKRLADSKAMEKGQRVAARSPRASATTTAGLKVLRGLPRSHITKSVGRVAELPTELSFGSTRDFDDDDDDDDDDGDSHSEENNDANSMKTGAGVQAGSPKKSASSSTDIDATVTRVTWASGAFAEVGEDTGALLEWVDEAGKPLLSHTQPLELCLYRAPVDNDRGGGPLSYHERWQAAGYGDLVPIGAPHTCHSITSVDFISSPTDKGNGKALRVEADWTVVSKTNPTTRIPATCTYLFLPSGAVEVSFRVNPSLALPILPRVGIRFACPLDVHREMHTTWFGLGPHESYADRIESCTVGLYQGSLDAMHTPYVVPGENGLRMDPRFFSLCDAGDGAGLVVIPSSSHGASAGSAEGYGFSVGRYSLEQLSRTSHEHLLRSAHNSVHVHVDCAHMGVGGYDSWSPNVDYVHQICPALPPLTGPDARRNPRFRDSEIEGSVLLSPTRWGRGQGQYLYGEFCRYGLW